MQTNFSFNSLTMRVLGLLVVLFVFIAVIVFVVIEWRGKPAINKMTAQTIIETGNEAVNDLMSDINHVDGLAIATSSMVAALPKREQVFNNTIGNLMTEMDNQIVGGGVWFNPTTFETQTNRKSFVWIRNDAGKMTPTKKYDDESIIATPYYRDWWFIPTMYANHKHCVWSRAYIDPMSHKPMMTCAKAVYNANNRQFDAVVSFNVLLDNLGQVMETWQKKTGGYAFLVDLDNRFLTFPNQSLVTKVTDLNPQGEKIRAKDLAMIDGKFAPIAVELDEMNEKLINRAKQLNKSQHEMVAINMMTTANYKKISEEESNILSALLLTSKNKSLKLHDQNFVTAIDIDKDIILGQSATAFIFEVPFTYWKMVIVKPQSELTAVANYLSVQLLLSMFIGFVPILLLSGWIFRRYLTLPLNKVATSVSVLSGLVDKKQYLEMPTHKLSAKGYTELHTITTSVNQLVDKVVENEGALAEVNVHLEKKVAERTQELSMAMNDLKASQVQLVRSEKMATLGQMVAGVAHEVNTPLGYVRSNLQLVGDNLLRFDELTELVEKMVVTMSDSEVSNEQKEAVFAEVLSCCQEIKEDQVSEDLSELVKDGLFGVDQIAELVVNLRDFSRLDESKIQQVNINDCIHNSLIMAKNNIKHMQVIDNLGDIPTISCNPSQVNQIFLNLFNNAAQAVDTGEGILIIESHREDGWVIINVSDNGSGMPEAVKEQVFEPFFTTKKAGEGTGLGLAISAEIMQQHQGKIEVISTVDVGTTFTLYFPIIDTVNGNAEKQPKILID